MAFSEHGSKSILDAATHDAIVNGVRAGLKKYLCAKVAGISRATLWSWTDKGKQDLDDDVDSPYRNLVVDIGKAKSEIASDLVSIVYSAARSDPKHWTAAAWILERNHGYTKVETVNQNHSGGIDGLSNDVIDERIKDLFKKANSDDNTI